MNTSIIIETKYSSSSSSSSNLLLLVLTDLMVLSVFDGNECVFVAVGVAFANTIVIAVVIVKPLL